MSNVSAGVTIDSREVHEAFALARAKSWTKDEFFAHLGVPKARQAKVMYLLDAPYKKAGIDRPKFRGENQRMSESDAMAFIAAQEKRAAEIAAENAAESPEVPTAPEAPTTGKRGNK